MQWLKRQPSLEVILQSLYRNSNAIAIAKAEAVGYGFGWIGDPDGDAFDAMLLYPKLQSCLGKAVDAQRKLETGGNAALAIQGDPNFSRPLGGQPVELERG
jgi:hypothetical protein